MATRMTQGHFELIADIIRRELQINDAHHRVAPDEALSARQGMLTLMDGFAWRLAETNTRFNRERFIARCTSGLAAAEQDTRR